MNDERERIVAAVDMQMTDCYVEQSGEILQVGDAHDIAMGMIAHLWSRADDPEVVEAVALGMAGYTQNGHFIDREHEAESLSTARIYIPMVLTALIGPRPTEQENNDER